MKTCISGQASRNSHGQQGGNQASRWVRCSTASRMRAVSYTHLDVYKRQVHSTTGVPRTSSTHCAVRSPSKSRTKPRPRKGPMVNTSRGTVSTAPIHSRRLKSTSSGSVSYTHLDVYKRQVVDRSIQRGSVDQALHLSPPQVVVVGVMFQHAARRHHARQDRVSHCLLYTSRCV